MVFEEICRISCEKWIESFPAEIPQHNFSGNHNKKIDTILNKNNHSKIKTKKGLFKFIIIAAILILILVTTTVFAIPKSKNYIVRKFKTDSTYEVLDYKNDEKLTPLKVNYIPKGFDKIDKTDDYMINYFNGEKTFSVIKEPLSVTIEFDTERYPSQTIKINDINAIYYKSENNYNGIIFNNGNCVFSVIGNIDKNTLIKIAQNIE